MPVAYSELIARTPRTPKASSPIWSPARLLCGGSFSAGPLPGGGFGVRAELPL
jgi:uncharacterized membrane protein